MRKLRTILASLAVLMGLGSAVLVPAPASAVNVFNACNGANSNTAVCRGQGERASTLVQNVIKVLLFIVGIAAVIMIIVGGITYVISNGDSSRTKMAKDTIFYAIIGLVIALLAFVIVEFVVGNIG